MKKVYFTVTGTRHYYGQSFIESGMTVSLVKDKENEHDREAIQVELPGLGKIGYVANSPYTVRGESYSAGRLYDKFKKKAQGTVRYVLDDALLCTIWIKG